MSYVQHGPILCITCVRSMLEESELFGAEYSISGYRLVDVPRNIGPASRISPAWVRVCAAFRLESPREMTLCYRWTLPSQPTYWDLFQRSIRSGRCGQKRRSSSFVGSFGRRRRPKTTAEETHRLRSSCPRTRPQQRVRLAIYSGRSANPLQSER